MITCPSCGHVQAEDTSRCEECGTPLDLGEAILECPACQAPNPADRQYCRHCFAALHGEDDAQSESLVSPYVPASASPDEFRVYRYPIYPFTRPESAQDGVDLDATIGEMAVQGAQHEQPPVEPEADDGEAAEAPSLQEAVVEDSPPGSEDQDSAQSEPLAEEPTSAASAEPSPQKTKNSSLPALIPTKARPPEQEEREPLWLIPPGSPLERVDNPIPMEAIIALPHRSIPRVTQPPTEQDRADARLFQQIAVEPAPLHTATLQILPRRPEILSGAGRAILYLLVLLAALSPILTGGQTTAWVQPRPAVIQLASNLSTLPGGSVVLVAFEYSPSFAGELNPLAIAVLRHLAAQSVPIVAMSTRPEGVGLAEQVLAAVVDATPGYTYGQDYVILGYLPGQEAGLRIMAHSMADAFPVDHVLGGRLDQFPPTQGLATIQDATQILLLADDDMAVRRWIEQLGSRYALQRSPLRFQALVTARVEPMLVAYTEAGQLDTVIAGVSGAPQYAAIISPATGIGPDGMGAAMASGLSNTDAFAALFALVLLVCVVTNLLYAVRGEKATAAQNDPHASHSTLRGKNR